MESNKPSLFKQALGALAGSAVALALYYSYEFAAPRITAYVTLPPAERQHDLGDARVADETTTPEQLKRIESRNRKIAERIEGANPEDYKVTEDEWKSEWPSEVPAQASSSSQASSAASIQNNDGWQDFIREPVPIVTATKTQPAQIAATHSSAPALPDSGIGSVMALVAAFGGAASVRFQPLQKLKRMRK